MKDVMLEYINITMIRITIYFNSHMVRIWEKKPVLSNTGFFLCYNSIVSSTYTVCPVTSTKKTTTTT